MSAIETEEVMLMHVGVAHAVLVVGGTWDGRRGVRGGSRAGREVDVLEVWQQIAW